MKLNGRHFFTATLLLLTLIFSSTPLAEDCEFIQDLSPYQRSIAYDSYRAGEAYDLGLTSVAIAWQESRLGLYKVRYGEGIDFSVGVGHTLVFYKTKNMSISERSIWIQNMIMDDPRSIDTMVKDILYWQITSDHNWLKGVGSYNGGYKPNMKYAREVAATVKELKKCEF